MTTGIYEIRNKIDNKVYIGKSRNIERRFKQHVYNLRKNKDCNRHLKNAFDLYGEENFQFKIIEELSEDCSELELGECELYWITQSKSNDRNFGYNLRLDTSTGTIVSDETRELIASLVRGELNPNFGNTWSEDQKRIASQTAKELHSSGVIYGEDWKRKISEKSKILWTNSEKLAQMSENVSISKSIYCFIQMDMDGNVVREWESMREILKENPDYHNIAIYSVCNGHKKSYRGFKWLKKSKI